MSANRKTNTVLRVEFPASELWNEGRKIVQFPAVVNNTPILCAITYDALAARYAAPDGPDKYAALDTFKANRPAIEALAKSRIKKGRVNSERELAIKPDKVVWEPAAVRFPKVPKESWDFDRDLVRFPAIVGEKRISCCITYEALWTRFGARGRPEESNAMESFRANRASIQSLASLLVEEGRIDATNELIIKSGDSLKEFAGIWKNDPTVDEMLREIYKRRGRPMTEDGQ